MWVLLRQRSTHDNYIWTVCVWVCVSACARTCAAHVRACNPTFHHNTHIFLFAFYSTRVATTCVCVCWSVCVCVCVCVCVWHCFINDLSCFYLKYVFFWFVVTLCTWEFRSEFKSIILLILNALVFFLFRSATHTHTHTHTHARTHTHRHTQTHAYWKLFYLDTLGPVCTWRQHLKNFKLCTKISLQSHTHTHTHTRRQHVNFY